MENNNNRDRLRRMILQRGMGEANQNPGRPDRNMLAARFIRDGPPREIRRRDRRGNPDGPRARFEFLFEDFLDPMMREMAEDDFMQGPRINNFLDDS